LFLVALLSVVFSQPIPSPTPSICPQHIGPPCPRYYNNTMPDYVPGDSVVITDALKGQMTQYMNMYINLLLKNYPSTDTSQGGFIYDGLAGLSMMFLKLYYNTQNPTYLTTAREYILSAVSVTKPSLSAVGYLEGHPGVYTLAAVISAESGDINSTAYYLDLCRTAMKYTMAAPDDTYDTGRAGVLACAAVLNNYFGAGTIPRSDIVSMAYSILQNGIREGQDYLTYTNTVFPDIIFWAEGHGSAGIINQFLDIPEILSNTTAMSLIKNTLDFYLSLQFPNGNFPTPLQSPYPTEPDVLVQWCHGAPGFMPLLTKASMIFNEKKYLDSAIRAANCTWQRGILTKGLMLCHGVSGNTYMLLHMYTQTKDLTYLYRAIKFQEYTLSHPILVDPNQMRQPTPSPYILWGGSYASAVVLWSDFLNPNTKWLMPGFAPFLK